MKAGNFFLQKPYQIPKIAILIRRWLKLLNFSMVKDLCIKLAIKLYKSMLKLKFGIKTNVFIKLKKIIQQKNISSCIKNMLKKYQVIFLGKIGKIKPLCAKPYSQTNGIRLLQAKYFLLYLFLGKLQRFQH